MGNPILHNWKLCPASHGSYIFGQIYNDNRFSNGKVVRTSGIVAMSIKQGIARTKNTIYDLGKEYKG